MAAESSAQSAQADISETQFLRRYSDYCMLEIGLVKQACPTKRQRKWNKFENKIVQERQDYLFEKRQGISDPLPIHLRTNHVELGLFCAIVKKDVEMVSSQIALYNTRCALVHSGLRDLDPISKQDQVITLMTCLQSYHLTFNPTLHPSQLRL